MWKSHYQPPVCYQITFKPNWRLRGTSAELILPNVAVPIVAPGAAKQACW